MSAVESNVVGYQTIKTNPTEGDNEYPSFGFTFQPIDDEDGRVSLKNVKMAGMDAYNGDFIYQLLSDSATPDAYNYAYYDYESAAQQLADIWDPSEMGGREEPSEQDILNTVGWWMAGEVSLYPEEKVGDVDFPVGSFFLGDIPGYQNIDVQCCGEAKRETVPVNISEQLYPTFANMIPRTITLSEIVVAGMDAYNGDFFYQLLPDSATPDAYNYAYYDYESAAQQLADIWDPSEMGGREEPSEQDILNTVGWWMAGEVSLYPEEKVGDREVQPGEAFIGDMGASAGLEEHVTVISFPKAVE